MRRGMRRRRRWTHWMPSWRQRWGGSAAAALACAAVLHACPRGFRKLLPRRWSERMRWRLLPSLRPACRAGAARGEGQGGRGTAAGGGGAGQAERAAQGGPRHKGGWLAGGDGAACEAAAGGVCVSASPAGRCAWRAGSLAGRLPARVAWLPALLQGGTLPKALEELIQDEQEEKADMELQVGVGVCGCVGRRACHACVGV